MRNYVQVSWDLYDMFEEASKKNINCNITFLKNKKEVTINSQIVDLRQVNKSEFLETADGNVIRLDEILKFNGTNTDDVNYYQHQ